MLSILIPTYNYNITALLKALNAELNLLSIDYEVICYEDGSKKHVEENAKIILELHHTQHIVSPQNKGRITSRQELAKMAKYDWLLFLDADVIPQHHSFINNYLQYTTSSFDVIYGGYAYNEMKPAEDYILRWKYGTQCEQVNADTRNKKPYKIVISGNFFIKKQTFLNINSKINHDGYGYDNYFGALLKSNSISVLHIDNNVIHNGLDSNTAYLKKVEKSIETIALLIKENRITTTDNTLLEVYKKTNKAGITKLVKYVFKLIQSPLKKQLTGSNPNIKLLQFYKLGYLCHITSQHK